VIKPTQERANEKLRFAKVQLQELVDYSNSGSNDDWENAHQKSCFYHLAGAVEAVLHEINEGYGLNLAITDVGWGEVRSALKKSNRLSPAYELLRTTKDDQTAWLWHLFEWRNHGTHRGRVGKMIHLSTWRAMDNEFKNPRTGQVQQVYPGLGCLDVLRKLTEDVEHLIDRCRCDDPKL
jgi:hypothetical protein